MNGFFEKWTEIYDESDTPGFFLWPFRTLDIHSTHAGFEIPICRRTVKHEEWLVTNVGIAKWKRASFVLSKFLESEALSPENPKSIPHMVIITPTHACGREKWTTRPLVPVRRRNMKNDMRTDPRYEDKTRKFNKEL